jgi:soluble epoxide hydrolase/lipid-phosphate phosphatase
MVRVYKSALAEGRSLTVTMDSSCYKTYLTSRSLNYHYFYQPGVARLQTLLFLHGFPSTSYDWHHQVTFFRERGFGVLVPDMLGYGGTAKPEEAEAYVPSLVTQDLVDLLDAEDIKRVVVVAHDWCVGLFSSTIQYT